MPTGSLLDERMHVMHPPIDFSALVAGSVLQDRLRRAPTSVVAIRTRLGQVAHVARVENVLYIPGGLQIVGGHVVPIEAIADPLTSSSQPTIARMRLARDPWAGLPYSSAFEATYVDEEVCILSNMLSDNFYHFSDELLKVVLLERAGLTPRYVLASEPKFGFKGGFGYLDALGVDRRRVMVAPEPTVFRSVLYATNIWFGDLSEFPDVFLELRERLVAAASSIASPYGRRLWLERGATAQDTTRDFVPSAEIDRSLDDYGFARLDMGALPLLDQIAAAHQAEVIAGPHGAAFIHCMFMNAGSTVIELFSPSYLNHCWTEICRLLNHRYVMLASTNTQHLPYAFGNRVSVKAAQLRMAFQSMAVSPDGSSRSNAGAARAAS